MTKKRKVIIILIVVLILALGSVAAYKIMHQKKEEPKITKSLDTIKGFDYKLEDRDKEIYKTEFKKLKENLEGKSINYEDYAKSIAKMFIIDLYTIDNKINKYDIGGEEFVHPDALENYKLNVKDTLYKYVDDNTYSDRDQELPEVTEIKIDDFKTDTYKIKDEETDCYLVTLSWKYKTDLKYDDKALITIVKKDKKLYVVEKAEVDETEDVDK
jgi:hypothetical protein